MATIIRDGKKIELTPDEVRTIRQQEHEADIRYNVEESLRIFEEDGQISFESWQDCPCEEYESMDDARSDFIECIVEHILDLEDISEEHAPVGFRFAPDYDGEILDTAKDFEYLTDN